VTWPTGGAVTTTSQERSRERGRGGEAAPVSVPAAGAAFFDLDRTLIAGSSAFEFARASYKAGLTTRRQLASDALANLRFRLEGSTDEGTEVLKERVMGALSGVRVRDIERLGADVLGGLLPRVYPQMLEIAYGHQDAGRPIFICTAASQEVADLLGHVLTFDGAIGTRSEIVDGAYTGRLDGPFTYREGKAQAVRELAGQRGIDLERSWAYSDSESDLPMLRAVGHPVAVNPDSSLARIADEEGWEVVRFETLGRRLKLGGALVTAALAGGIGGAVVRRRAPARRIAARPRLPRR
jgi:HAD superfamily hydrolase (TIGR01490 family)